MSDPSQPATLPRAARVVEVEQDNYRTKTFTLDTSLPAYPGQFVMVWLPGFDEKPFSLVSADPVRVMITSVGPFTDLIHEQGPGDRLWVRGPFGHGFALAPEERHALLVGGGYGVAPLHWLAECMVGTVERITVVIGARSAAELLYVERFRRLVGSVSTTQVTVLVVSDDGSAGVKGIVTDAAAPQLASGDVDTVYACGPHAMLVALRELGRYHRVPCQLSWEAYMRCGLGLCGACEVEGSLLCMDGPVVRFEP